MGWSCGAGVARRSCCRRWRPSTAGTRNASSKPAAARPTSRPTRGGNPVSTCSRFRRKSSKKPGTRPGNGPGKREGGRGGDPAHRQHADRAARAAARAGQAAPRRAGRDRKSTRLNSSHSQISYAVFCLKKKKKKVIDDRTSTQKYIVLTPER